jgi:hypothetical protein
VSKYGEGVHEPYAHGGLVRLLIDPKVDKWGSSDLSPDEARLLGLRLIKMADEADGQDW